MDYNEAIGYFHSMEKFGIRPGLERISVLCAKLGDPQNSFSCIHVAGTNGKGSTCTEIASVLTAAGYKTGLYTSPYVIEFRERIRFCGEMIGKEALVSVTQKVKAAIEELAEENIAITEFEAVTAAAFLYYKEVGCEIAVLETGLGGRFDATNIIRDPLCCVITSVSYDHMHILGNSLAEIANEKCGIVKKGSPVITSINQHYEVLNVIKNASWANESVLHIVSNGCFIKKGESIFGTDVRYRNLSFRIPFCGDHQLENSSLVVSVIDVLREKGYKISDAALKNGIEKSFVPARTEIIKRSPLIILDGSHNEGSTAALASVLSAHLRDKKILAVMGMMADKDCSASLNNLLPFFAKVICVKPSNPRSMPAEEFRELVKQHGRPAEAVNDPCEGVDAALKELSDYDALIVCGSLYLSADVREHLLEI